MATRKEILDAARVGVEEAVVQRTAEILPLAETLSS
jgi:hypothetical protein